MILLLHISFAITSIIATSLAFLRPSQSKLKTSYILVGGTLISGTYLTLLKPAHLTETCIAGLTYISLMGLGIALARFRLAKEKVRIDRP